MVWIISQPKWTHVIWESLECCDRLYTVHSWIAFGRLLFIPAAKFHRQDVLMLGAGLTLYFIYFISVFSFILDMETFVIKTKYTTSSRNTICNYCSFMPFVYFTLFDSHLNRSSYGYFFCTAQPHQPSLALAFNFLLLWIVLCEAANSHSQYATHH